MILVLSQTKEKKVQLLNAILKVSNKSTYPPGSDASGKVRGEGRG